MRGLREPLLLIATGIFLCAFWLPATLGFASIAFGLHELRRSEAGASLGRWRAMLVAANLVSSLLWISALLGRWEWLVVAMLVVQTLTLLGTGMALRLLALRDGATGLARALFVSSFLPLAYVPLLLTNHQALTTLVYSASLALLGCLVLGLRGRAVPYGRRAASIAR